MSFTRQMRITPTLVSSMLTWSTYAYQITAWAATIQILVLVPFALAPFRAASFFFLPALCLLSFMICPNISNWTPEPARVRKERGNKTNKTSLLQILSDCLNFPTHWDATALWIGFCLLICHLLVRLCNTFLTANACDDCIRNRDKPNICLKIQLSLLFGLFAFACDVHYLIHHVRLLEGMTSHRLFHHMLTLFNVYAFSAWDKCLNSLYTTSDQS